MPEVEVVVVAAEEEEVVVVVAICSRGDNNKWLMRAGIVLTAQYRQQITLGKGYRRTLM